MLGHRNYFCLQTATELPTHQFKQSGCAAFRCDLGIGWRSKPFSIAAAPSSSAGIFVAAAPNKAPCDSDFVTAGTA